ncbi:Uncharacterised protein [Salmonella enterica subsp. enterica serovar Bovismorbificans]|uniref:Uncharacterized protein n=1 Tax=Salmonella enterica subsp. enterica serovar Bovismorbificans TaxID=58097 RepID=A0A655C3N3_SALET|nr:Uncharacterised protein [Salmonella enterica subsp. enterica serovar Bovismorbificans]CNU64245.1 Uncharacterised protein [Salmonella enterica subsp. enterica serovar Bovismorbificans]
MECAGNRPNHGGDSISIIADINAGDNSIYRRIRTTREQAKGRGHRFTHVQPGANNIGNIHYRRFPMAMTFTDIYGQLNASGNGRPGHHHRPLLLRQQIAPLRTVNTGGNNAVCIGLRS